MKKYSQQLTWADFYFTAILETMNVYVKKDMTTDHPNLKQVVENVLNIESIKEWVAKRPVTEL